jgi:peptide/nickel transport system substrate-binding protein
MMTRHRIATALYAAGATGLLITTATGCQSHSNQVGSQAGRTPNSAATFAYAINADPGSLNPLASQLGVVQQIAAFLYDPLVHADESGKITAGLASSWSESGTSVTFHLRANVTCSDGQPLRASDVAATLNYVADPKNNSPLIGMTVPADSKATASADGTSVTLTTPRPTGFLLNSVAALPIVCGHGLANPKSLVNGADGTGPYTLSSATPGSQYNLTRRPNYTWGSAGASTDTPGLPKSVVIRVITNETTAANLLVAGQLNAATVVGPDRSRLQNAGLTPHPVNFMYGEFVYNQATNRPTHSAAIRRALTQALDLAQLRQVALSGTGTAPTRLTGTSPCSQDTVSAALPQHDTDAAKAALSSLHGHPLTLVYLSKLGAAAAAAADLATQEWKAVGVTVKATGLSDSQLLNALYKNANFDIAWVPIDGQNPVQVMNNFSGPAPAHGGNNFAEIDNSVYNTLSAQAAQMPDTKGCATWAKADSSLVSDSDVVPFADSTYPIWTTKNTSLKANYVGVDPITVRMYK